MLTNEELPVSHNAVNLASILEGVLEEWGLSHENLSCLPITTIIAGEKSNILIFRDNMKCINITANKRTIFKGGAGWPQAGTHLVCLNCFVYEC